MLLCGFVGSHIYTFLSGPFSWTFWWTRYRHYYWPLLTTVTNNTIPQPLILLIFSLSFYKWLLIGPYLHQEGNKLMFLSEWREFPSASCLAGGKTGWKLAFRCWNRAFLICFWACILPDQAKYLTATRSRVLYIQDICIIFYLKSYLLNSSMPASVHFMEPYTLPAACPYACYRHECIKHEMMHEYELSNAQEFLKSYVVSLLLLFSSSISSKFSAHTHNILFWKVW